MQSTPTLLAIRTGRNWSAPESALEQSIYETMDAEPPSPMQRALRGPTKAYLDVYEWAKSAFVDFDAPDNKLTRSHLVADSLPILKHYARRLYTGKPYTFVDGLTLIEQDDSRLGTVLKCAHGQFRPGVVYREHPYQAGFYIELSSFQTTMLHDRLAECQELLVSLGAKRVRVLRSQKDEASAEAHADVSVPIEGVDADFGGGGGGYSKEFVATALDVGVSEPVRPPGLPEAQRWYHHERMWQSMATSRLKNLTTTYRFEFINDSDFGVNARLSAKVEGFGLDCGGKFEEMRRVRQLVEVDFFSAAEYRDAGIEVLPA